MKAKDNTIFETVKQKLVCSVIKVPHLFYRDKEIGQPFLDPPEKKNTLYQGNILNNLVSCWKSVQRGEKLTRTIPINIAVEPTIITLSLYLIQAHIPMQEPVMSPPKMVPIKSTAPEQSYATSASTPVDWKSSHASLADLLNPFPYTAIY